MRLKIRYRSVRYLAAGLLIILMLLAACSQSIAPTPTAATSTAMPTEEPAVEATATPAEEAAAAAIESFENISFTSVERGFPQLDVHAPTDPGPWPVVVVVHGLGRGREAMKRISETIASEGAVVYNTSALFAIPWSESIEQTACAVRFAHATAAEYGGDPDSITLLGYSVGAATGAVVALAGDDFAGDCIVTDKTALPNALVVYEGPYDYITEGFGEIDHTTIKDEDPELWEAINPYSHIGHNPNLQVRLIHGQDDDRAWFELPPQVSVDFQQALADAGYDATLTLVEGAHPIDISESSSDAFQVVAQQTLEVANGSSR